MFTLDQVYITFLTATDPDGRPVYLVKFDALSTSNGYGLSRPMPLGLALCDASEQTVYFNWNVYLRVGCTDNGKPFTDVQPTDRDYSGVGEKIVGVYVPEFYSACPRARKKVSGTFSE